MGLDRIRLPKHFPLTGIILAVAAVQGVICMLIFPPWQHYDEPGHFEYAWLVANRPGWPKVGDYDAFMRRDLAASMIEHGFYRDTGGVPNLLMVDQPTPIGISQVGDLPLYYFIASIPLRIFQYTDITFQLYTVRFISVLFFVLTVWVSLQVSRELFLEAHPLRWMVPLLVAWLPGFWDLMTAANNDVAAVAFFSLFFWCSIPIIRRGVNLWRLIGLITTVIMCVFTKSTVWLAAPLSLVVILLGLFKGKKCWMAWGTIAVIAGLMAAFSFSWKDTFPQYYLNDLSSISSPARMATTKAPLGRYALVQGGKSATVTRVFQLLSQSALKNISGKKVTLGVWAWADQAAEVRFPSLVIDGQAVEFENSIQVNTDPQFFAYEAGIPDNAGQGWLVIYPGNSDKDNRVYWDAFILADGAYSGKSPPVYKDANGISGEWGGVQFQNSLRNPSLESGWPAFSPKLLAVGKKYHLPVTIIWTLADWQGSSWYIQSALGRIYRTFWGYFGWGGIPLTGSKPYRIFIVPILISMLGLFLGLWNERRNLSWNLILFGSLAVILELGLVLLRGAGSWFIYLLLSTARYGFPVILPVAIGINYGLYQFAHSVTGIWKCAGLISAVLFVASLFAMNVWGLLTVATFYY